MSCDHNNHPHYHGRRGHEGYHRGCGTSYPPAVHPGLMGVFGAMINLATSSLQGGARIVKTVVEGSVWYSHCETPCLPMRCSCCCGPVVHRCHVECVPRTYGCCCCC